MLGRNRKKKNLAKNSLQEEKIDANWPLNDMEGQQNFKYAKEYKKSYKGFLLWFLIYFLLVNFISIVVPFIVPNFRPSLWMKCLCLTILLGLDLLVWIVWKTENVYWYNGIEFEEAKEAGRERRKEYARAIMSLFVKATIVFVVYAIAGAIIHTSELFDIIMVSIMVIIPALMTVKIKL